MAYKLKVTGQFKNLVVNMAAGRQGTRNVDDEHRNAFRPFLDC